MLYLINKPQFNAKCTLLTINYRHKTIHSSITTQNFAVYREGGAHNANGTSVHSLTSISLKPF